MALSVRDLTLDDYSVMRAFWEAEGFPIRDPGPESADAVAARMELSTIVHLGLFDDDKLCGTALVGFDGLDAWLRSMVVAREARAKRGVADLLQAARERAAGWGAASVLILFPEPRGGLWDCCVDAGCKRFQGRAVMQIQVGAGP